MNNMLNQILGKMNYEDFLRLNKKVDLCLLSSLVGGLSLSSDFLSYVFILLLSYEITIKSKIIKLESHLKDVSAIREIYNEIITSLAILMKELEVENPALIMKVFNYLTINGYLSNNHTFSLKNDNSTIYALFGANIMTGTGACRHLATMLTDILKELNLKSANLPLKLEDFLANIVTLIPLTPEEKQNLNYLLSQIYFSLNEDEVIELAKKYLSCPVTMSPISSDSRSHLEQLLLPFNHLITICTKDKQSYYLDPTRNTIFFPSLDNTHILRADSLQGAIIHRGAHLFNNTEEIKNIKTILANQNVSKTEVENLDTSLNRLITTNKDSLDNFYQKNAELYSEINDKMSRIRTKKISH